jgi:hypothetical protein
MDIEKGRTFRFFLPTELFLAANTNLVIVCARRSAAQVHEKLNPGAGAR